MHARTAAALAVLVFLSACGSGRSGVPSGSPSEVVRGAADRTLAASRARVVVDGPDGRHSEGEVDLRAGTGTLALSAPGAAVVRLAVGQPGDVPAPMQRDEYTDPGRVLGLVRYAEHIDPFGGLLVRGVGTVRYDVNIRPPDQRPFYADVYVDAAGRVRRLTVPEDRADHRVKSSEARIARLITIDVVYP